MASGGARGGLTVVAAIGVHPPPAWPMIESAAASAVAPPICPYDFLSEMPVGRFCVYRGEPIGVLDLACRGPSTSCRRR